MEILGKWEIRLGLLLVSTVVSPSVFGQTYTISTFAGGQLPVNIPGTSASLGGNLEDVTADQAGNLFIAVQNTVLRLDATTGVLTLAAGNGTAGFSGDGGPATSAQLYEPFGVAVDSAGNLYIADTYNNRIRKVSNGVITTVAGNGNYGFGGDSGPATSAQLNNPTGVAVDSVGNLYIADAYNSRVRKVANGVITTVAGNGTAGYGGDNGPAASAELNYPETVAVDSAGNLYIADTYNSRIRKVANGAITTVAGDGESGFSGDGGPATSAELYGPYGVAADSAGNLYIADNDNSRVREVSNGIIATVAGNGTYGFSGDNGPATSATVAGPFAVGVDSGGNLYIVDNISCRIRKVSKGVITTVAGNGLVGDNGPATSALLVQPSSIAADSAGNLYIADSNNSRVRKVLNGAIATVAGESPAGVAGGNVVGYSGDNGPAFSAYLSSPYGVAVDAADNLYIADTGNSAVREVSNGVIRTVAGDGNYGFVGDNGPATGAELYNPAGVAVDSAGNLYIADTDNNRIRKVSNGVITTVAGNGVAGFSGDNGPAISAALEYPEAVAVDSAGNLYIADTYNSRIRKVSNGAITTVAGNGTYGYSGDNGLATSAQLNYPEGVAVDSAGNLYIADTYNNRIRKVSSGTITTVAGNGLQGFSGDNGSAAGAQLDLPYGVTMDAAGKLYIADLGNGRIRLLTPPPVVPAPSITPGGITPVYSTASAIQPGEWVSIYGTNLASAVATWTGNFPTSLGGTSVTINGKAAYLWYVSPGQINLQAPNDTATGTVPVVITTAGGSATSTVTLAQYAPSFLLFDSKHVAGIILRPNGSGAYGGGAYDILGPTGTSLGYPTVAAKTGDIVELFGVGFGPTSPAVPAGEAFSGAAPTTSPVTFLVNNVSVAPTFAGLSGAGLYQLNLTIPAGLGTGDVSLQASVGGAQTPSGVVISLQ